MNNRIDVNPKVMLGKPVIKGTRITVEHILKLIGQGLNVQAVLKDYLHLKQKDIKAAIDYATETISQEKVYPLNFAR